MIKSLVFDKDGVLLDLIETWLPVMQGLAEYTLSLVPADSGRPVSRAMLLSSVGINDDTGRVDPNGLFARGSFFEIRARKSLNKLKRRVSESVLAGWLVARLVNLKFAADCRLGQKLEA